MYLTPVPVAANQSGFEAYHGKLYYVGGEGPGVGQHLNTTYAYDPATDTWTKKADLPIAVQSPCLRVANDTLFCIGGYNSELHIDYTDTYMYDDVADTWTKKADMGTGREDMGSAVINDKIYIFGGKTFKTGEVYDPVADTWTPIADMPDNKLLGDFGEAYNGKAYACDASNTMADYPTLHTVSTVYVYDPAGNTWDTKAAVMPLPRCYKEVVQLGDHLVIGPGCTDSTTTYTDTIYYYYPATDSWVLAGRAPYGARGVGLAVLNGKVYMCGGYDGTMRTNLYRLDQLG